MTATRVRTKSSMCGPSRFVRSLGLSGPLSQRIGDLVLESFNAERLGDEWPTTLKTAVIHGPRGRSTLAAPRRVCETTPPGPPGPRRAVSRRRIQKARRTAPAPEPKEHNERELPL